MLQTIDVLIGFVLVMLVMSMAVTMITQFLGTWLLNLKGIALREGIARLIAMLDSGLSVEDSRRIATHILCDPLVGQPRLWRSSHSLGTTVHREELVKLILDFASAGDASKVSAQMNPPGSEEETLQLRHRLRASLARNGIANPGTVLDAVRTTTLKLEKTRPELGTGMRATVAILNHATSEFLAKVNNWFDQTIDRVSESFTARIRMVTFAASLAVALLFQLNALQLINRLSVDDELRDQMAKIAIERVQKGPPVISIAPKEATAPEAPAAVDSTADQCIAQPSGTATAIDLRTSLRDCVAPLEQLGLIAFPKSGDEWIAGWGRNWSDLFLQLVGILLSAALLSLGAPFWYAQMANLVRLRSVVSGKDDAERAERQTTQPATEVAAAQRGRK